MDERELCIKVKPRHTPGLDAWSSTCKLFLFIRFRHLHRPVPQIVPYPVSDLVDADVSLWRFFCFCSESFFSFTFRSNSANLEHDMSRLAFCKLSSTMCGSLMVLIMFHLPLFAACEISQ